MAMTYQEHRLDIAKSNGCVYRQDVITKTLEMPKKLTYDTTYGRIVWL